MNNSVSYYEIAKQHLNKMHTCITCIIAFCLQILSKILRISSLKKFTAVHVYLLSF